MLGPLPTIVREVDGAMRAVCWCFEFVTNGIIEMRRRGTTLVKGFIVIVDLYPICSKLGNLLIKFGPTADIVHNVLECGMVAHILIRMKDNGNRLMLTLKWCLGGNIDRGKHRHGSFS